MFFPIKVPVLFSEVPSCIYFAYHRFSASVFYLALWIQLLNFKIVCLVWRWAFTMVRQFSMVWRIRPQVLHWHSGFHALSHPMGAPLEAVPWASLLHLLPWVGAHGKRWGTESGVPNRICRPDLASSWEQDKKPFSPFWENLHNMHYGLYDCWKRCKQPTWCLSFFDSQRYKTTDVIVELCLCTICTTFIITKAKKCVEKKVSHYLDL